MMTLHPEYLSHQTIVGCYALTGRHCLTAQLIYGPNVEAMPAAMVAACTQARAKHVHEEAKR